MDRLDEESVDGYDPSLVGRRFRRTVPTELVGVPGDSERYYRRVLTTV